MKTTDYLINDFTNPKFQAAFKQYFKELDIKVSHWDELFTEMNADPHEKNHAYLRMSEDGEMIGFIQFTTITAESWFFDCQVGFIREFWIAKAYRRAGHGAELLRLTEENFLQNQLHASILTSDTAEAFYRKQGYTQTEAITARNNAPVFIKILTCPPESAHL